MKAIVRNIPNSITSLNLLCGCIAVVHASKGDLEWAAIFIWTGAFFDFFDGLSARLLKAYSPLGKELDSLADMVTFGLAPSLIVFSMMEKNYGQALYIVNASADTYIIYTAFLLAVFSALRLAKFNIDTRQTEQFIGLATPANAIFFSGLPFLSSIAFFGDSITDSNVFLVLSCFIFSYLMISELPMFSLKMKNFSLKKTWPLLILLIFSAILLIIIQLAALPFIIMMYILLSFLVWIFNIK
jgi:CDP-diacylglycerol---serine O-phosphatidyltransferase